MAKKNSALKKKEVDKKLKNLNGWSVNKGHTQINRTFVLPSFITALAFVAKIAVHAEVLDHHPDIELSYGKVKVKLTTHSVKGLTSKDFQLAKKIDELKEK